MILIEFLGRVFIQIILEGIILGFFRLIGKGIDYLKSKLYGIEKPRDPIKELEKKYRYKKNELTDNLNSTLKSGLKGVVLEVIDTDKVFAEFYDENGKQLQWNDALVFEIEMDQFRLKK